MENKILSELESQTALAFEDVGASPLKVSLGQFYGLEIKDFGVSVASTALWIAQLQANIEAQTIITSNIEDLPLVDAANIHHGNALRMDWAEVITPEDCDYIIGNPPFLGARNQNREQKAEIKDAFPVGTKNVGNIDYVAGWFIKAAQFMGPTPYGRRSSPRTPSARASRWPTFGTQSPNWASTSTSRTTRSAGAMKPPTRPTSSA